MMKTRVPFICVLTWSLMALSLTAALGREYHVTPTGDDVGDGSPARMLKTISAAAAQAQPGDTITIHAGVYRERIDPPRGGTSDAQRITYQAAPGERVEIKGSEIVKNWQRAAGDAWKTTVPNTLFGPFNPFADVIRGDWFGARGRVHHTGAVYLNGDWLREAAKLDDVLGPVGAAPQWFAEVAAEQTTIWAQFPKIDPNQQTIEINVRRTVFYPSQPGKNFITVRGLTLRHAAPPWAPPTAEQIGLLGTHWSKGWIIENNTISHSRCAGITLGKYGDEWDNKSESADAYNRTIERALAKGWDREHIGSHIVRNNTIAHCEQAGLVGSLGAAYSVVTGNVIHDCHVLRLFSGAEMAGIKFHGAIDVEISRNYIHHCCRGVWLDWMAQGARVTANLFHDNPNDDLFVEVNHGPFVIDNNIFLSPTTVRNVSHGGAYAHNLVAGGLRLTPFDGRKTPYHPAHATAVAGLHDNPAGDDRWYNNLFVRKADWSPYAAARLPAFFAGNVFTQGTKPAAADKSALVRSDFDPDVKLTAAGDDVYLEITTEAWAADPPRKLVTTELLGQAAVPKLKYERPDGTALTIDTDYFGRARKADNPFPGPWEIAKPGRQRLKVWPVPAASAK